MNILYTYRKMNQEDFINMVTKRKFNSVSYADEGMADKKSLIKIYKKRVDNFLNSEYNKSTKREVSSW